MRRLVLLIGCALLPLANAAAQRESVKTTPDSTETKVKPPANTPGGEKFKKPKNGGPEAGGDKTAGVGTMATTDTENQPAKDKQDKPKSGDTPEAAKDAPKGERRRGGPGGPDGPAGGDDDKQKTAYDFDLPSQDGKSISLSTMKGKVLLIVNLGRLSSYNAQLAGFEKLSKEYKDKGLVIIGIPSNDFGNAEPGTPAEVAKAYADAKVDFLVTDRSTLTGVHQLPLYGYLTKEKSIQNNGVAWTYTKFLVDRKGKVILRFGPDVAPDSLELQAQLQSVLDGTWKPKKEKPRGGGGEGGGPDGPA